MKNGEKSDAKVLGVQYLLWFFAVIFYFFQYGTRSVAPSVLNEELQHYFMTDASGLGGLVGLFSCHIQ